MTWSAWDEQGREWKFQRDVSISGPDDEKCEVVTPILRYEDMETFQELLRQLRHAGAKSSPSRGCGVHIHIGLKSEAGNHNAKTLRNLVNIMAAHETQIGRAIRIDAGRIGSYCRTVNPDFLERVNRQKPTTMERLADCWYEGNHANYGRHEHYNRSRYAMCNLHKDENASTLDGFSLELFEDLAFVMYSAAHPDEKYDSPDEWLDNFQTFSIYQILPQLIDLWGMNIKTNVPQRKN